MKTYTQFVNENEGINEGEKYEYGCAMLYLAAEEIANLQKEIAEEDLQGKGLEDDYHVTLLYGLHSDEISDDEIMKTCCEPVYPKVRLYNVSLFENPEFDVLKFDAECPMLTEVNRKLVKFPHTTNFPDYHPHATIAYLKPGTGQKYVKAFAGRNLTVDPTQIVYSKPDGSKVVEKAKIDKPA
jgi:2'-5' RNA ligase